MKISSLILLILITFLGSLEAAQGDSLCQPFRVHTHFHVPYSFNAQAASPATTEAELLKKIAQVPGHTDFEGLFTAEVQRHASFWTESLRQSWLECLLFYISQDTDSDGQPDWTAIVNHKATRVLLPLDSDVDGDGLANIYDPQPFQASDKALPTNGQPTIPAHLLLTNSQARLWQQRLYEDFSILAIDHTDHHTPVVLKSFYELLKGVEALQDPELLNSIRYLYAFKGHDSRRNIAAYHHTARALSIGGHSAYGTKAVSKAVEVHILSSLAHEIGHAFLFQQLSSEELHDISVRFGRWNDIERQRLTKADSLFSRLFFRPHPFLQDKDLMQEPPIIESQASQGWQQANVTSEYAMTNTHEWFADAFAAAIMNQLGEKGTLGPDWRRLLVQSPHNSTGYWVNYNNISATFRHWLKGRFSNKSAQVAAQNNQ